MSTAVISIKVDENLKKEATDVSKMIGLPIATYLKMSLNKLVRERGVNMTIRKPSILRKPQKRKVKSLLESIVPSKGLRDSTEIIREERERINIRK